MFFYRGQKSATRTPVKRLGVTELKQSSSVKKELKRAATASK